MSVTLVKPEYNDHIALVKDTYAPQIVGLLTGIAETARRAGFQASEVQDMSTDDYRWYLDVRQPGSANEDSVSVEVEIVEQRGHDGEGWGVSFRIEIESWGGGVLGMYAPGNYTPRWVVDSRRPDLVEQRWHEFAAVDVTSIMDAITDELARQDGNS